MTYTLTPEQSARWDAGGWESYPVEQEIRENLQAEDITGQVVILLDDGSVACNQPRPEGRSFITATQTPVGQCVTRLNQGRLRAP